MGIIKDLWYGRIDPQESGIYNTPEVQALSKKMSQIRSKLESEMTDEQKELFSELSESRNHQESLLNVIIFECGFKLGAKITAEALLNEDTTEE